MFKDIIGKRKKHKKQRKQTQVNLFHNTINTLIAIIKENKAQQTFSNLNFPYDTYALECSTIKCSAGRLTGKSGYIKKYADKDSLVIVPNLQMKAMYLHCIFEICSAAEVSKYQKEIFKTIYIEEPTYVFKIATEQFIYKTLAKNYDQIYIQLGS